MRKHPGLTNREFTVLGKYVRSTADMMGLRDWLLNLEYEVPENADAAAHIEPIFGKHVANLRVSAGFKYENRPERQRQFIVHELLHCHFDTIDTLTCNELHTHVGEIYWQAWHPGFHLAIEHTIDAIADAWAPAMPLIKWPVDNS